MRRPLAVAVAAALTVAGTAVIAPAPASAATHQVRIEDNVFLPKVLEIEPGDTVTWTALRPQHSVTADDGRFDFPADKYSLDEREQVSWTFETEEVFRYHCRIHGQADGGGMSGLIKVGDPPPPPVPDVPTVIVPDDVPTIGAAATGAQPGTQVLVRPGIYQEEVVVTVPDLEIRGLGTTPADVVIEGADRRAVGITIAARDVEVGNLTVRRHLRAGVVVADGIAGAVVSDTVLHANGLHGIDARSPAGITVRRVTADRHSIAAIAVRSCERCGARIDEVTLERNAAGIVAVDATGVVVQGSDVRGNAVGIVLRDVAGALVSGNDVTDNAATKTVLAGTLDGPEPPNGAGIFVSGGRSVAVVGNSVTGHTYNVAVTGPAPVLEHRVTDNVLTGASFADLGIDAVGTGVCVGRNRRSDGAPAATEPPGAATLYDCGLPATAVAPYPVVSANLAAHASQRTSPI